MINPEGLRFKDETAKAICQLIHDDTQHKAAKQGITPNVVAILTNLATIYRSDMDLIMSLASTKKATNTLAAQVKAKRFAKKTRMTPKSQLAANSLIKKAAVGGADPDCPWCDEDAKKRIAARETAQADISKDPESIVIEDRQPLLPPEVLNPPPVKEEEWKPELHHLNECDTVEKMLLKNGQGNVTKRELRTRLIALCEIASNNMEHDFKRTWGVQKLAEYLVESVTKPVV